MSTQSIMIVEDDEGAQFYLSVLLNKFDPSADVIQAYDGQEATFFLAEFQDPPNLIFLDINMPIMDGLEFLAKNRDVILENNIEVVILTSTDSPENRAAVDEFSFVKGFLMKPVDAVDIKAFLAN